MTDQPDPVADAKVEKPYSIFLEVDRRTFFGGVCDVFSDEIRQAYYVAGIAPIDADGYVVKLKQRMLIVESSAAPVIDRDRWRLLKEHIEEIAACGRKFSIPALRAIMKNLEEKGKIE